MAARTGRPYKLQVLSTNGERKLQGSANNPTDSLGGSIVLAARSVIPSSHHTCKPPRLPASIISILYVGLGADGAAPHLISTTKSESDIQGEAITEE